MKKKALLSSILTIALCLSLIAGSTYALFTSQTVIDIAVTSGKVQISAELLNLTTSSWGKIISENVTKGDFEVGGTAEITKDPDGNPVLAIDKMVPGDAANVNIEITNTSDVSIKYKVVMYAVGTTGIVNLGEALEAVAVIDGDEYTLTKSEADASSTDWILANPAANGSAVINTLNVNIYFPNGDTPADPDHDNEYQGGKTDIYLQVVAVQANADYIYDFGDTVILTDSDDLANVADSVADQFMSKDIVEINLAADLDLAGKTFDPIYVPDGKNLKINGNGYKISNFVASPASGDGTNGHSGIVGRIPANSNVTVSNLTISGVDFAAQAGTYSYAGVIAGEVEGNAILTIDNVHITDAVLSAAKDGYIGGFVGATYGGSVVTVKNSSITKSYIGDNISGAKTTGGVAGYLNGGTLIVENTVVTENTLGIKDLAYDKYCIGSVLGRGNNITVRNCTVWGNYSVDYQSGNSELPLVGVHYTPSNLVVENLNTSSN